MNRDFDSELTRRRFLQPGLVVPAAMIVAAYGDSPLKVRAGDAGTRLTLTRFDFLLDLD